MSGLTWDDIDLAKGRMRIYRQKTDTGFMVPIYPQLRPRFERMHAGKVHKAGEKIFVVANIRKVLAGACARLGFPQFTQRALRRCFITRAVELGIDFKAIASMRDTGTAGC